MIITVISGCVMQGKKFDCDRRNWRVGYFTLNYR